MITFLARRLVLLIPVMLGTVTLTFILMHMAPGDPARTYLGDHATVEAVAALHLKWGLDQPIWVQYLQFLRGIVTGDLGESMFFHQSVTSLLAMRLVPTLTLMALGALFSVVIAVPLAIWTALSPRGWADVVVRSLNAVIQGAPVFFISAVLIAVFSLKLKLFPVAGYGDTVPEHIVSLILPAFAVSLGIVPVLVRSLRSALIGALNSEYVRFAAAKGLPRRQIWLNYALRNAAISGISILSIQIGFIAGGSLVVENVFAIPGMGSFLMKGILNRDFPVVQACALAFAVLIILVYLLADIAYSLADPRVRLK